MPKSKRPATEAPEVVSDQDRDGTSGALAPPTANRSAASEGDAARRIADLEQRLRDKETALRVANGKLTMALEIAKLSAWDRNLADRRDDGLHLLQAQPRP